MKTLASAVQAALQGSQRVISMYNSAFDPKQFLETTFNEASSTVKVPVPAKEHRAVISAVDIRSGNKDGKDWSFLDVTYDIDEPAVKELLGREKVVLTQGVGLDFTPTGGLDFGKGRNVTLGRLRDAVGLNQAGQPFGFRMLIGKPLKIVVGHTPSTRPGAQPGDVFENVNAFVKI